MQIAIFGRGTAAEEIRQAYEPVHGVTKDLPSPANASMRRGAGVQLGLQGQMLISSFLGDPGVDVVNNYCVLC